MPREKKIPKCCMCEIREGQIERNGYFYCVRCHTSIFGETVVKSNLPEGDEIKKG